MAGKNWVDLMSAFDSFIHQRCDQNMKNNI